VADSRLAWARLTPGEIALCEAPRHDQEPPPAPAAEWRVCLVEPDEEPQFWSSCTTCLDLIAVDLGTTAVEGAARL
jgi:hypothetical protein